MNFILIFLFFINYSVSTALAESIEKNSVEARIVGGSATPISRVPWQVKLHLYGHFFCGGSILTSVWIVSAAHCIFSQSLGDYTVHVGEFYTKQSNQEPKKVIKIIVHELYNRQVENDLDVSLLKLDTQIQFSPNAQPIPLSQKIPPRGTACTVSGYGHICENCQFSETLKLAWVYLVDYNQALVYYPGYLSSAMLAAQGNGVDACQGDSGGPLVCKNETNNQNQLLGIVSWGYGCGDPKHPGIYTSIPKVLDWINNKIASN